MMTGEIHITREVVDRLVRGVLSRDERQVLLEHLDNGGSCERCNEGAAVDDPDDRQPQAILDRYAHLHVRALRRRAKDGDQEAVSELHRLRFQAFMRKLNE